MARYRINYFLLLCQLGGAYLSLRILQGGVFVVGNKDNFSKLWKLTKYIKGMARAVGATLVGRSVADKKTNSIVCPVSYTYKSTLVYIMLFYPIDKTTLPLRSVG